jgi:hypothetical protein
VGSRLFLGSDIAHRHSRSLFWICVSFNYTIDHLCMHEIFVYVLMFYSIFFPGFSDYYNLFRFLKSLVLDVNFDLGCVLLPFFYFWFP